MSVNRDFTYKLLSLKFYPLFIEILIRGLNGDRRAEQPIIMQDCDYAPSLFSVWTILLNNLFGKHSKSQP